MYSTCPKDVPNMLPTKQKPPFNNENANADSIKSPLKGGLFSLEVFNFFAKPMTGKGLIASPDFRPDLL